MLQRDPRPDLAELSLAELDALLAGRGLPRYRARQIFAWIWKRGATAFTDMTDLGRDLRVELDRAFRIGTPHVERHERSEDGTRKLALRLHEVGMIRSTPQRLIAQATDWRFLNELTRELKA